MLQTNRLQSDNELPEGLAQGGEDGGIGSIINFVVGFLRRRYLWIIVSVVLAIAACFIYLRITPPTYTAQAQILLAAPPQFVKQQSLAAPEFDLGQMETQLQIIRSRAIAVAVIKQLKLEDDPDIKDSGPSFFSSLWRRFHKWVLPPPNERQVEAADQPPESMIQDFQERLSANRVNFSNVIEVSFSASSATQAAEIANATAQAYIADQLNAKLEANRLATRWLQERLRDLAEQALQAERTIGAYRSQKNIVSSGGKLIDEQQVTELSSRLVAARAQASEALARLNRYETTLNANLPDSAAIGTLDAAGADALSNPIINSLREKYLDLSRRESEYSARFGRDHLAVVNIRRQMRDLRTSILDEVKRLAEFSRGEVDVAKRRQEELEKRLAEAITQSRTTDSAELTIRSLENQAKALRSMYDSFLQRYMGSLQQETFPITETRVLSPASPPQFKSKPKGKKILVIGLVGGLGLGIALGLLKELMDRGFRTSAQVERALELPCLSLVPLLPSIEEASPPLQSEEDLKRRYISTSSAIHRAVVDMPLSRYAEAIRSIKLAIDLSPDKTSAPIIGITSAMPNEGKTTISTSLAQLIAHCGKKVIVIDCDLRKPMLTKNLAPKAAIGLAEIVSQERSIEEAVWRDPKTNLVFLPAAGPGPVIHTTEILSAEATRELFAQLRADYDYIIVDLPPLAPVVDVRATSMLIDRFVLVVQWGQSKIDTVQHALHVAPHIYERMMGVVLNKTDIKEMVRWDSYTSDYYSDKHYALYGLSDSG